MSSEARPSVGGSSQPSAGRAIKALLRQGFGGHHPSLSAALRAGSNPEMPVGESMAGSTFEVAFESLSAGQVLERNVEFHFPGKVAGSMRAATGIVIRQPLFEVGGVADVVLGRLDEAFQNVSIKHGKNPKDGLPSAARSTQPDARS
jgi:hypothetical protein